MGNDSIYVNRDGEDDYIDRGAGDDTVYANGGLSSRDTLDKCETVVTVG